MKKIRCKFIESCNKYSCFGCDTFEDKDYVPPDKEYIEDNNDENWRDCEEFIEFAGKFVITYRMIKERKLLDGFSEKRIPHDIYYGLQYQEFMKKN